MINGWQTKSLGEVCRFERGLVYTKTDEVKHSNNGVLRANNVDLNTNKIVLNDIRYISDKIVIPKSKKVRKGSIIICTASGSKSHLGKVALIEEEYNYAFGGFMGKIEPGPSLVPKFLFHIMTAQPYKDFISSLSNGMSINNLKYDDLKLYSFSVPPLSEQTRIVAILDEAFAGINTAVANAEKNLANARELFESSLQGVFARRGEEWERLTLGTLLERGWIKGHLDGNHGSDYPRKEEFISAGIPYISANCLLNGRIDMTRAKYLAPSRAALLRKGLAQDGDVLFAHNATVGPVAILHTTQAKVVLGTSLTYYRCNTEHIKPEYLFHYMQSLTFKKQYNDVMRQSTRNQVPITKQREFYHIIPSLAEQETIVGQLDNILESGQRLQTLYKQKLDSLGTLKQTILHKAFSGELTTPSAAANQEAAE